MASQQYDWFVQLPDKQNVLQTRLNNHQAHLENLTPQVEAGKIIMRGVTFSAQPANADDGEKEISGSVHVVRASTEKEVWELVEMDPYAKLGVWDLEKVTIAPMKVGIVRAM